MRYKPKTGVEKSIIWLRQVLELHQFADLANTFLVSTLVALQAQSWMTAIPSMLGFAFFSLLLWSVLRELWATPARSANTQPPTRLPPAPPRGGPQTHRCPPTNRRLSKRVYVRRIERTTSFREGTRVSVKERARYLIPRPQ